MVYNTVGLRPMALLFPLASSKQQTQQFSPLDATARESSLVTEDHRSSSAILPAALLPDQARPCPGQKSLFPKLRIASDIVSVTQPSPVSGPVDDPIPKQPTAHRAHDGSRE